MKPMKITLKEDTSLSLDAVTRETKSKGTVLTSENTQQKRLFQHLVASGKAVEGEVKVAKKSSSKKSSKKKSSTSKK